MHVEDPLDWHRTGLYQYVVVGWDAEAGLYEAWEASGLHTRRLGEAEVLAMIAAQGQGGTPGGSAPARSVAWWDAGELLALPDLEAHSGQVRSETRDAVFPPRLAGWKPYGTLEMVGPMFFQLDAQHRRAPERFQTVCDVGAGTGRMSAWLNQAWGFEVTAFDIALPEWPEYSVQQFDGRRLPLADKSVDVVLLAFVLHHCRHFESQRVLLLEAARVARTWILVAEDTPADDRDKRQTRFHDRLGEFHSSAAWRATFRRLQLHLALEGPIWKGPKHGPSPYPCTRCYFVLEVPTWLCPAPAANGQPGLSARCCGLQACRASLAGEGGAILPEDLAPVELDEQDVAAAAVALADLRGTWLVARAEDALAPDAPTQAEAVDITARSAEGHGSSAKLVQGRPCDPLTSFAELRLPEPLQVAIQAQGFATPTPIQSAAVPAALAGADLVGIAATGSGKTLAYLLPSLLRLLSVGAAAEPFILVLVPTRELALQVAACAELLLPGLPLAGGRSAGAAEAQAGGAGGAGGLTEGAGGGFVAAVAAVWGGGPRWEQRRRLRSGASLLVATPGRLLDLACEEEEEGRMLLSTVRVLVLDEGDRMLEEGLGDQLEALSCRTAPARQTLFFSATWPEQAGALARRFCRSTPILVRVGSLTTAGSMSMNAKIVQRVEVFDRHGEEEEERESRKRIRLLELLKMVLGPAREEEPNAGTDATIAVGAGGAGVHSKALVFCMTKKFADALVEHLIEAGWPAAAVHGNKSQKERLWNLDAFATGATCVLVATDVLGRGLDIPRVTHVFVYDFPSSVEEYLHRIGRTARGVDGHGEAVAFFEFVPSLPNLAGELICHLKAAGQVVPDELQLLAAEVASGARSRRNVWEEPSGKSKEEVVLAEGAAGAPAAEAGSGLRAWLPLARPEELGEAWHAGGQRSWMFCEGHLANEASGWLVFCSEGKLQTSQGEGAWSLTEAGHLIVEFGARRHELSLHQKWEGRHRENFSSVSGAPVGVPPALTGWVTRSKTYKYRETVAT